MTEVLPMLLYFQSVQQRIEQEAEVKEHEENLILEMQQQLIAMKRSQEICRELNNGKKQNNQRPKAKTKGSARRLDRPQRRNAK